MRLSDYLDKGASLNPTAPCLTMNGRTRSYADVQRLSWLVAEALARSAVRAGDKVAVLSVNDPIAAACVFGIARAGAIWCPVDPRREAGPVQNLLELLDCSCLIFQEAFSPLVARIAGDLPRMRTLVCLDGSGPAGAMPLRDWLARAGQFSADLGVVGPSSMVVIASTSGPGGRPRGAQLTAHNIDAMAALTLMSYPFTGRPVYLALAPMTHEAGALCVPVLALGGHIVLMPEPDLAEFLTLVGQHEVTHAFLPAGLISALVDHPALAAADLSSLQCLWYGAAPMPPGRLATAVQKIGPVLGQFFGQPEAPMVISALPPAEHFRADGSMALERYSSAGRPTPLTTVGIMDERGALLPRRQPGEIVVRGPLVMAGYYRDAAATAHASRFGWHHTGDTGYLDAENYLYLVESDHHRDPAQQTALGPEPPRLRLATTPTPGFRARLRPSRG
jgi:fatty-acyl-CoA synthase